MLSFAIDFDNFLAKAKYGCNHELPFASHLYQIDHDLVPAYRLRPFYAEKRPIY